MLNKILISAGETSGDEHGAAFVAALRKIAGPVEIRGMGGKALRQAGVTLDVDAEKAGSVMGFAEVLGSLKQIHKSLQTMKGCLESWKPDALVLIDYPDFNLRLAKFAKAHQIPVFYFITPKVWAWRSGRVKTIAETIAHAAVIFPFEPEFFLKHGFARSTFVGHPFAQNPDYHRATADERADFLKLHGLDPSFPTLALFPGSRRGELNFHLPIYAEALALLRRKHPEVQALIAVARAFSKQEIIQRWKIEDRVAIVPDSALQVLRCADAGLIKSGTSNIQAALTELPFVMCYKASPISEWIGKRFIPISEYSIVNILKPGLVRELVLKQFTPEIVAEELASLLFDQQRRAQLITGFREIKSRLSTSASHPGFRDGMSPYERAAVLLTSLEQLR